MEYLAEDGVVDRVVGAQHIGHTLDLVDEVDLLLVAAAKQVHVFTHKYRRARITSALDADSR